MNWFLDFISKKKKLETDFSFVDIEISELDSHSSGISNLQNRSENGFIIRNVLSESEIKSLIQAYEDIPEEELSEANPGMIVYPPPFSMLDQNSNKTEKILEQYYKDAVPFWEAFSTNFGVDIIKRITSVIDQIADGRKTVVPKGVNGQGHYHPATFRFLEADKGEFKAHCGNFFHKEFPTFYQHMKSISNVSDQMSYFIILQPSDFGGELTLYNMFWEDAEIRTNENTTLVDKEGKQHNLSDENEVGRQKIRPNAGDMIIFSGGRIWHKVEVARGTPRVTFGGFLSISKDNKELYIWS